MKRKKVHRPGARNGYDMWAASYDDTPNPLVALDRRYTLNCLMAKPAEHVLDAGCGTCNHLFALKTAGSQPVGVDLSRGMLRIARRRLPGVPLAQANLNDGLPLARGTFDATVCSLVSEHLTNLRVFFTDAHNDGTASVAPAPRNVCINLRLAGCCTPAWRAERLSCFILQKHCIVCANTA